MRITRYIISAIMVLALYACGDPTIEINEVEYEQKIVVDAYLYPGSAVSNIRLTRNFPLETTIDSVSLTLTPAKNSVDARINGIPLLFDSDNGSYYNNDINVEFNKSYKLEVSANIDGQDLYTESETLTPGDGFKIINKSLGTIKYRFEKARIDFMPSPGTTFYAFSVRAEGATLDNFIYNNPFIPNQTREEIEDDFDQFLFQMNLILNINSETNEPIVYEVKELDTWFYTDYSVIVYGGDENFKDYLLTVNRVQQPDGNFIEPEFHFKGDGIGVFGSAVRDTVYFTLVK